jgi:hypothetical protein
VGVFITRDQPSLILDSPILRVLQEKGPCLAGPFNAFAV